MTPTLTPNPSSLEREEGEAEGGSYSSTGPPARILRPRKTRRRIRSSLPRPRSTQKPRSGPPSQEPQAGREEGQGDDSVVAAVVAAARHETELPSPRVPSRARRKPQKSHGSSTIAPNIGRTRTPPQAPVRPRPARAPPRAGHISRQQTVVAAYKP